MQNPSSDTFKVSSSTTPVKKWDTLGIRPKLISSTVPDVSDEGDKNVQQTSLVAYQSSSASEPEDGID